jgi:hypothetical protein
MFLIGCAFAYYVVVPLGFNFLIAFGSAVDVTNNAADKVTDYVKENELDKKAKSMADEFGDAMKSVGKSLEDTFSNIVGKK